MKEFLDRAPNRKIGSIERVGDDGFIVEAEDKDDPQFSGGKRLFYSFNSLAEFIADHLHLTPAKLPVEQEPDFGGNGKARGAISLYEEKADV